MPSSFFQNILVRVNEWYPDGIKTRLNISESVTVKIDFMFFWAAWWFFLCFCNNHLFQFCIDILLKIFMWLFSSQFFHNCILRIFIVFSSPLTTSRNWFLTGKVLFQIVTLFFSLAVFSNKPITFFSCSSVLLDSSGTVLLS